MANAVHETLEALHDLASGHAKRWYDARRAFEKAGIDAATIAEIESNFDAIVTAIEDASAEVESAINQAAEDA